MDAATAHIVEGQDAPVVDDDIARRVLGDHLQSHGLDLRGIGDSQHERRHAGIGLRHLVEQARRRLATMTWLLRRCKASAMPRPMPDVPPMAKMVFPLSCTDLSVEQVGVVSGPPRTAARARWC